MTIAYSFDSEEPVESTRVVSVSELAPDRSRQRVRSIRRSVFGDFRTWTELEFIDMGDTPLEHLYTNASTPRS